MDGQDELLTQNFSLTNVQKDIGQFQRKNDAVACSYSQFQSVIFEDFVM